MNSTHVKAALFTLIAFLAVGAAALACPFCAVEQQTLSEEMESADAVVLARLIKEAPADIDYTSADPNSGTATFEVVEVLRGEDRLGSAKEINAVYFGAADRERSFLIMGLGSERLDWGTPLPLSPAAMTYVRKLPGVPASGPDRLAFFQEYFEHEDPLLAQDAYDEFARSPYADVQALGPRMHHDRLINWISDLDTSPSRRRLYLTMLGVCGTEADLPLLESMITSDFDAMEPHLKRLVRCGLAMGGPLALPLTIEIIQQDERRKKLGLDAMVACYLTLRGADGLDLIDERFLRNQQAEYTHIYSTIMALRFHGDEQSSNLPRDRLLQSMRLLLDNPDFADQVILDLSRWEDWSVLDRLVQMFKSSDQTGYVRQPVVTYLTVASEQPGEVGKRAAAALEELERFDPNTVKQARTLMAFGTLGRARASGDSANATRADANAADATAFAASAADEATDTSDMPDPAAYEQPEQPTAATANALQTTAAKPATSISAGAAEEPAVSELNPKLAIGVPLLAALLLMGVYWLILRAGAV